MSLFEKYKWFQDGIIKAGTEPRLQKFFKTNPTEEQIILLSERETMRDAIWLVCIIAYFIGGLMLGYLLFYSIPQLLAKLSGA